MWRIIKRTVRLRYSVSGAAGRGARDELLFTTLPPSCVPVNDQLREI